MPWLPMYLNDSDAKMLVGLLCDDPEIAFLISDGPKRWKAVERVAAVEGDRIGLWHVPSGPLPLLAGVQGDPDGEVRDPWKGWEERRTGADPAAPYFGAGHHGIFWLNLRPAPRERGSLCGMSSFEWIGNRYGEARPETDRWWKALRRKVTKVARKVPRKSLSSPLPAEIFAFPGACAALEAGGIADQNPL